MPSTITVFYRLQDSLLFPWKTVHRMFLHLMILKHVNMISSLHNFFQDFFFLIHSVSLRNFLPLSKKKKTLFHCNFWKLPPCGSYLSKFNTVSSMHYSGECHCTENRQFSSALLRGTYKLQGWGGATTHPIAE